MIIGISGKIGSGKDTVGQIIRYLTSGHSGKYSFQDYLEGNIDLTYDSIFDIRKYADKLKEIASILTGIDIEKFEDQDFKLTTLGKEWDMIDYEPDNNGDHIAVHKAMTVREFLQKLGTDAMRYGLHQDVWVNALMSDYRPMRVYSSGSFTEQLPDWVVTDVRFPNEATAILRRDGHLIRINRPGLIESDHISETALDNFEFDNVIDNSGDINDLIKSVEQILRSINILT